MIKNILTTTIVFFGIDIIWLGLIAKNFYDRQFESFQRRINWPAAILTYFLLIIGITFLALPLADNKLGALAYGALFGLVTYGVYDLTNYATLSNWPLKLVIVDIVWGMFLCGVTAYLVKLING